MRSQTEERDIEKEESVRAKTESSAEKPDTLGESSPVDFELDASEIHHPPLGDTSRGRGSGVAERTNASTVNDNTSVCSNVSDWQTKNWRRK